LGGGHLSSRALFFDIGRRVKRGDRGFSDPIGAEVPLLPEEGIRRSRTRKRTVFLFVWMRGGRESAFLMSYGRSSRSAPPIGSSVRKGSVFERLKKFTDRHLHTRRVGQGESRNHWAVKSCREEKETAGPCRVEKDRQRVTTQGNRASLQNEKSLNGTLKKKSLSYKGLHSRFERYVSTHKWGGERTFEKRT